MFGRDHARTRQFGIPRQCLTIQPYQIGHEQEQPSNSGGEFAWREREATNIGNRLGGRPNQYRAFLIEPPGQRSKALRGQDLPYRGGAQYDCLLLSARLMS
jgi:hypothetical protein